MEDFARKLEICLVFSSKFRAKFCFWFCIPFLPIMVKIIGVLVFSFFIFILPAHADSLQFNDAFPYGFYGSSHQPSYCLTTAEVLVNDEIFVCKKVTVHPLPIVGYANGVSASVYGRGYCWQSVFGGWWGGYGRSNDFEGILLSQKIDFSMSPPAYDSNKICVKKSEIAPQVCDINITSVVNGAFSNKFPLDLFTGFAPSTSSAPCPSFTIENQTFSLCYINDLTRVLKYTLLLVFIISSVISL